MLEIALGIDDSPEFLLPNQELILKDKAIVVSTKTLKRLEIDPENDKVKIFATGDCPNNVYLIKAIYLQDCSQSQMNIKKGIIRNENLVAILKKYKLTTNVIVKNNVPLLEIECHATNNN